MSATDSTDPNAVFDSPPPENQTQPPNDQIRDTVLFCSWCQTRANAAAEYALYHALHTPGDLHDREHPARIAAARFWNVLQTARRAIAARDPYAYLVKAWGPFRAADKGT